jgi:hypothetical protein
LCLNRYAEIFGKIVQKKDYTDWTNNIVQYGLSPHCTICLIPSALTPESIRDKIYKILAYDINHIGITVSLRS